MKLNIQNISKVFGNNIALKDVSLNVECKILALIGPSGGGKSTLLKILAGLQFPDQGSILINGNPMVFAEAKLREHRRSVGTVFQGWNLFPHLTALENISLPLQYVHGHSSSEAKELSLQLLKRFNLKEHTSKKPYQLSGGQCQRVAIIRAVAIKPKMLLFDEPTSALDPLMTAEVLDLIVELTKEGSDLIIASHHINFVRKLADHVAFLNEGKLEEAAPVHAFFQTPQSSAVQHFLEKVLKY